MEEVAPTHDGIAQNNLNILIQNASLVHKLLFSQFCMLFCPGTTMINNGPCLMTTISGHPGFGH